MRLERPKKVEELRVEEMIERKEVVPYDPEPPWWCARLRRMLPRRIDASFTLAASGVLLVVVVDLLPLCFDGFGRMLERALFSAALGLCQVDEGHGELGECVP
eukprot:841012-Prymnesium_polylepis.1